jgi:hypothetical protein
MTKTKSDTAWERLPLTHLQKRGVWMLDEGIYTLLDTSLSGPKRQLPQANQPGYQICENNRLLFIELELFFVKVNNPF